MVSSINQGKKWRGSKKYIEIKYENLINETIVQMEKVFDFLNLEMVDKDRILNFYKYEQDHKHPQNIEVGKSIYAKSVGRWKKDVSKKGIGIFKKMAGGSIN